MSDYSKIKIKFELKNPENVMKLGRDNFLVSDSQSHISLSNIEDRQAILMYMFNTFPLKPAVSDRLSSALNVS